MFPPSLFFLAVVGGAGEPLPDTPMLPPSLFFVAGVGGAAAGEPLPDTPMFPPSLFFVAGDGGAAAGELMPAEGPAGRGLAGLLESSTTCGPLPPGGSTSPPP